MPAPRSEPGNDARQTQFKTHAVSDCDLDTPVPDWAIDHPETLAIFEALGIDTACGGKSLRYACLGLGLDPERVLTELFDRIAEHRSG